MSGQRQFLGESPEQRRARRQTALLDATLDQVAEAGLQSTSARSVCARAGLTSRYFYESFENLDDLLATLLGDIAEEIVSSGTRAMEELRDASWDRLLRHGLDAAVGVAVDDPRKGALLAALAAGHPVVQRQRRAMVLRVAQSIRSDPTAAAIGSPTLSLFVAGGLVELTLSFVDGELPVKREELVEEMAVLITGAATAAAHASSTRLP